MPKLCSTITLSYAEMCAAMEMYLNQHVFQESVAVSAVRSDTVGNAMCFIVTLNEKTEK